MLLRSYTKTMTDTLTKTQTHTETMKHLRRTPRKYKIVDYTGMDTIEDEFECDTVTLHQTIQDNTFTHTYTKTPSTKTPSTKTPSTKTHSTKTPSTKTPSTKTPSTKTHSTKTHSTKTHSTKTHTKQLLPIHYFIQNYLSIFEDVKKKYNPIDFSNKYKSKIYYIEIMRVILELYSVINEHFDIIYDTPLAIVIHKKAIEFTAHLYDIHRKYRLRGHDLSLAQNCIHELLLILNYSF